MTSYTVKQILKAQLPIGTLVKVNGWVRTRRDSKAGLSFIQLHDGSCFAALQVVASENLPNYESEVLQLTSGASIAVTGTIVSSAGDNQALELQATAIDIYGLVEAPESYPIQPKPHTLEFLRTVPHLRPRTNLIGAVTRIRHSLSQAIHRFLHEQGFYWIHTPIITSNDCEGAGEMFRVSTLDLTNLPMNERKEVDFTKDFFGGEAFLTVSGQLNVEAYCLALSKVYTFGPTFRAENSNTSRHLAEFWMIEPEIAFSDLLDDARLAEALLKFVFKAVLNEQEDDLAFLAERVDKQCIQRLQQLIDQPFVHMDYTEGVEILQASKHNFQYPVAWGTDLQSEHERYLAEQHVKGPVVLMNYPKEIKSFYMRLNDDDRTVAAMDILAPGIGEIIGGSQREERLSVLDARMQSAGLNITDYSWYRDLRRYGTVPHAGFGLGFERLVSYVTGVTNVRDVISFPRTPGHCEM